MRSRTRFLLLPILLLSFACGGDEDSEASADEAPLEASTSVDDELDDERRDDEGPGEVDRATPSSQAEIPVSTMVADLEEFWLAVAPDVGLAAYEPLDPSRILAVSDLLDGVEAACDDELLDPDEAADNAFVAPCAEGITVVYDDEGLFPELRSRFGEAGPVTTMAHEWGHVIQAQVAGGPDDLPSLIAEQQADCYAGAYSAWATEGAVAPFDSASTLDAAVGATIESRDETGTSPDDEEAHGNGFDRVRAFQEGFDRGVGYCADYVDTPLPITQIEFESDEEADSGGNLSFDDAVELLDEDTADFFGRLAPDAEPPPLDTDELRAIYDRLGDNAVGLQLALDWGMAAQTALGEETGGEGGILQRACLAGAWLGEDLEAADAELTLSPGDLDEAVLALSQHPDVTANPGLVFEAVASLRIGIIDGLDTCRLGS